MTASSVIVRKAVEADSELIWKWRNDPDTRAASRTTEEVPWSGHKRWFARALADPNRQLLLGSLQDEPIGVVRFDRLIPPTQWEVSINLAPVSRGRRLSVPLLAAGHVWLAENYGEPLVVAYIRETNTASLRTFERAGYVEKAVEDGWTRLELQT